MLGVLTGKGHSVASCSTVAAVTGAGVDSCCGSGTVLDIVSGASHC